MHLQSAGGLAGRLARGWLVYDDFGLCHVSHPPTGLPRLVLVVAKIQV